VLFEPALFGGQLKRTPFGGREQIHRAQSVDDLVVKGFHRVHAGRNGDFHPAVARHLEHALIALGLRGHEQPHAAKVEAVQLCAQRGGQPHDFLGGNRSFADHLGRGDLVEGAGEPAAHQYRLTLLA
jgi:hypothetical protein